MQPCCCCCCGYTVSSPISTAEAAPQSSSAGWSPHTMLRDQVQNTNEVPARPVKGGHTTSMVHIGGVTIAAATPQINFDTHAHTTHYTRAHYTSSSFCTHANGAKESKQADPSSLEPPVSRLLVVSTQPRTQPVTASSTCGAPPPLPSTLAVQLFGPTLLSKHLPTTGIDQGHVSRALLYSTCLP